MSLFGLEPSDVIVQGHDVIVTLMHPQLMEPIPVALKTDPSFIKIIANLKRAFSYQYELLEYLDKALGYLKPF